MDTIQAYFSLVSQRPELFTESREIEIVLDEGEVRSFAQKTGKCMGVVYNNSPYYMVLADLCRNRNGLFSYARVISCNPESNGTVAIPYCEGKFGLLSIFRHAPREQMLEFPRGFAEICGITPQENVRKELSEELGVYPEACTVTFLGNIRADSGLCGGKAQIYLAEFTPGVNICPGEEEGITGFFWVSEEQLREMIQKGIIEDGYTIAAYTQWLCHRNVL